MHLGNLSSGVKHAARRIVVLSSILITGCVGAGTRQPLTNDQSAASAGFFTSEHFGKFPRIQVLTIEEILAGKTVQMPQTLERTFKQAEKMSPDNTDQTTLGFE